VWILQLGAIRLLKKNGMRRAYVLSRARSMGTWMGMAMGSPFLRTMESWSSVGGSLICVLHKLQALA